MVCYECSILGEHRDAIGICHYCSIGVCTEHSELVAVPITSESPITKEIVLPRRARHLFCQVCRPALEQIHADEEETVETASSRGPAAIRLATVSSRRGVAIRPETQSLSADCMGPRHFTPFLLSCGLDGLMRAKASQSPLG